MTMKKIATPIVALLLTSHGVFAAVTANSFVTPQAPKSGGLTFTSSGPTAGTFESIYTGGPNGSICNSLVVTSADNVAHNVQWGIFPGGNLSTPSFEGAVTVVADQGLLTPSQPLLAPSITPGFPIDQNANMSFQINSGDQVEVSWNTGVITIFIAVYVECKDY